MLADQSWLPTSNTLTPCFSQPTSSSLQSQWKLKWKAITKENITKENAAQSATTPVPSELILRRLINELLFFRSFHTAERRLHKITDSLGQIRARLGILEKVNALDDNDTGKNTDFDYIRFFFWYLVCVK